MPAAPTVRLPSVRSAARPALVDALLRCYCRRCCCCCRCYFYCCCTMRVLYCTLRPWPQSSRALSLFRHTTATMTDTTTRDGREGASWILQPPLSSHLVSICATAAVNLLCCRFVASQIQGSRPGQLGSRRRFLDFPTPRLYDDCWFNSHARTHAASQPRVLLPAA
ncbi:hypothetical protein LZ31DRAFT_53376 [Colletotrichum somersetense]|nr:hypothetical protein LZ31DRAFT_53376 [Colletotrichum somersetense]